MTGVGRVVLAVLLVGVVGVPAVGVHPAGPVLVAGLTPPGGVAASGGVAAPAGSYGWPLWPPPAVGRPFQPPSRPYGPGHRGADLVGADGQAVLSAGAGVVVYAAPLADRGVVSVDHAGGLRTTYEPVRAGVRPGQVVAKGQPLGVLAAGHPGCLGAACLHWGLRRERTYLDPLVLVRPARVRLLPYPPDQP